MVKFGVLTESLSQEYGLFENSCRRAGVPGALMERLKERTCPPAKPIPRQVYGRTPNRQVLMGELPLAA